MKKSGFTVLPAEAGPLVQFVARRLEISEAAALEQVREGSVHVDRRRTVDSEHPLAAGQKVVVYPRPTRGTSPLRVVYEDEDLVVIDKPAGLPTAATRQSAKHAADALLRSEGRSYVGVLHRLDTETSGLVLFSKRRAVNAALQRALTSHEIERTYAAVVAGGVRKDEGRWSSPIGGRPAATRFEVVERGARTTLLRLTLETGRTHQIRIHAAAAGHPVVGDVRYGGPLAERMMLHAEALRLRHPRTGAAIELAAPFDRVFRRE